MSPATIDVPLHLLARAEPQDDSRLELRDVDELAASIASVGLLQPVGVRVLDDGYYRIVYGHRRVSAVSRLGWRSVPAVLVDAEPGEDALRSLVENVQRRQLNHRERAIALEQLLASGLSGNDLSARTGIRKNIIYSWLRVARSQPLMAALGEGLVGIHEARILSSLSAAAVNALVPELQGKPEVFRQMRIQRALDDERKAPPKGFYKAHVEGRTKRLLLQISELMKGVREVRTNDELQLVKDILDMAAKWRRDLERATTVPP